LHSLGNFLGAGKQRGHVSDSTKTLKHHWLLIDESALGNFLTRQIDTDDFTIKLIDADFYKRMSFHFSHPLTTTFCGRYRGRRCW